MSNLTFSQIFWLFPLFWFTLKLSCESSRKEVLFWFSQWQNMWILNLVGMSFSWCQSQKWWCHCISPVFYYNRLSLQEFWWHTWNIYSGCTALPNIHHSFFIFQTQTFINSPILVSYKRDINKHFPIDWSLVSWTHYFTPQKHLQRTHTFMTENESNLVVAVVKAIADNFDEIIELDF